jgi:tetratricopeptide (TPR) repeat protein
MKLYVLTFAFVIMCISTLKAHGDLDQRIETVNAMIESFPDSASLYFKRGKLRFQHEEYKAAIDDINESIAKGFDHEFQNIYLAKSLYKLDKYHQSMQKLTLFLHDDPNNVVALNLKARILFAQQKFEESALHFENVIQLSIKSLPENYLEAVQSWSASSNLDKYSKTVNILEAGIKNLGPIITLQNKLIATHLENNNRDMAIEVQHAIIEKNKRKETAYFNLAEIYIQLNEFENAERAARNALAHLAKLPRRIQQNSAMKTLKGKIQHLISKQ